MHSPPSQPDPKVRAAFTCTGSRAGSACNRSAAAPVTCGVAKLVPSKGASDAPTLVSSSSWSTDGARRSGFSSPSAAGPREESLHNLGTSERSSNPPTVIALCEQPGDSTCLRLGTSKDPEFPAATTTIIPLSTTSFVIRENVLELTAHPPLVSNPMLMFTMSTSSANILSTATTKLPNWLLILGIKSKPEKKSTFTSSTPGATPLCSPRPDAPITCATHIGCIEAIECIGASSQPSVIVHTRSATSLSPNAKSWRAVPTSTSPTRTPLPLSPAIPDAAATCSGVERTVCFAFFSMGLTSSSPSPSRYTSPRSARPGTCSTGTRATTNESVPACTMSRAPISSRCLATSALFSLAVASGSSPPRATTITTL